MSKAKSDQKSQTAADLLRESEEKFRLFIEHAPAAVAMFDREMRYLAVSNRWLEDYNLVGEIVGRSHYEVFPEIPERWKQVHRRALKGEVVKSDEDLFERADGSIQILTRWEVRPWTNADGTIGGIIIFTEDITERKQVEENLKRSEELFRRLAKSSPVGIFRTDADGKCTYVNEWWLQVSGLTFTESLGDGWMKGLHPDDRERVSAEWTKAAQENLPFASEYRFINKDGREYWVTGRAVAERDADGKVTGFVGTITDITESKRAEEKLRASEELLSNTFAGIEGAITISEVIDNGGEFRFLAANRACIEYTGIPAEKWRGARPQDLLPPADAAAICDRYREAVQKGGSIEYEELLNFPAREIWALTTVTPLRDANGVITRVVATSIDITERKWVEKQLRESEERYRGIVSQTIGGIAETDLTGRFLTVNDRYCAIVGYRREELIGKMWMQDITHEEDLPRNLELFKKCLTDGTPFEIEKRYVRKDGLLVWVHNSVSAIRGADGEVISLVAAIIDVTERRKAEERLAEQRRLYKSVTDNATTALFIMDERQQCVFMNPAAEKLTGYSLDETIGRALHDVVHHTHSDGSPYPLTECPIDQAFPTSNQMQGEEVFVHKDGHFYDVAFAASPLLDENGTAVGTVIEVQDITERKQAEEALRKSEKFNRTVLESSPDCLKILDGEGRLQFMNANGLCLMEIDDFSRFKNECWWNLWTAESQQLIKDAIKQARTGETAHFQAFCPTVKGTPKWWDVIVSPILDADGELRQIISVSRDITESKRTESQIRESEERFRMASDAAAALVYDADLTGKRATIAHGLERVTGYASEESDLSSSWWHSLIHPEDLPAHLEKYERHLKNGGKYRAVYRIRRKDGAWIWVEDTAQAVKNEAGEAVQLIGAVVDITERREAEEQLRYQFQLTQNITDTAAVAIFVSDNQGRVNFLNPEAEKMFGWTLDELKDKNLHDTIHYLREDGSTFLQEDCPLGRVYVDGTSVRDYEGTFYRKDGTPVSIICSNMPVIENGKVKGEVMTMLDITERKQSEEKLRESEERLNLALKGADLGTWDWNIQTGEVFFNERSAEIVGYTLEEIKLRNSDSETLVHPEDQPLVTELINAHLEGKTPFYESVHRVHAKSGDYRWIQDRGRVFERDADGKPMRVAGTYLDITQAKLEELNQKLLFRLSELIRESEGVNELFGAAALLLGERLSAARCFFNEIDLINQTASVRSEFHREGLPTVLGTHSLKNYSEKTGEEVEQGRTVIVHDTETDERTARWYKKTYRPEKIGAYVVVPLMRGRKWTATLWVSRTEPQEWQNWEVGLIETIGERVWLAAEKLRGEIKLRESETRLKLAEEAAKGFNYEWNLETGALTRSESIERILGYRREELEKTWQAWIDLIHPDDLIVQSETEAVEFLRSLKEETFSGEYRVRHKNGQFCWMMERGLIIHDGNGKPHRIIGQTVDVTERKNAEEKLLEAERRAAIDYRRLLSRVAPLAQTLGTAQDLTLIYRELLKFIRLEIPCDGFFVSFYDAEKDERIAAFVWSIDLDEFDASTLPPISLTGAAGPNARAVHEGKTVVVDNYRQLIEGNSRVVIVGEDNGKRPASSAVAPMIVTGKIIGTIEVQSYQTSAYSDEHKIALEMAANLAAVAIENARLMEIESKARAAAEEANRLKDEFLATVSHELRTPLNAILGWSTMAQRRESDAETINRALEVIERNARNQNQLISDILDVSRIITGKLHLNLQTIRLSDIVRAAIDTVRPSLSAKKISLETIIEPDENIKIKGDSDRLQQIVWNLLANAVKFTPESGKIEVVLKYGKNFAEIVVTDSGEGIESEFLPFVFDRFRQADANKNRKHGGLGLGLAVVRHLTEIHGGSVMVKSEGRGRGAAFTIHLPFNTEMSSSNGKEKSSPERIQENISTYQTSRQLENLKILVIDDQQDALNLANFILTHESARVLTAQTVDEALKIIDDERELDAIITDIGMPEKDGFVLMRELQARIEYREKSIPAIALTAYAGEADKDQILAAGFKTHLAKPFEPAELINVIVEMLSQKTASDGNNQQDCRFI